MIGNFVRNLLAFFHLSGKDWQTDADFRRKYIRHSGVRAEVMVGTRAYSLRDWSLGGVSFETEPDARLMVGDKVQLVLRFRFPHKTVTIQQQAHVVRSVRSGVAARFAPLTGAVRREFDRVLDGLHAEKFMLSQAS
jgi:hypothetical protein